MAGPLSITDLFTPLTAEEIRAKLVIELLVLEVPADKWAKGGVASSILTVTSILLALLSSTISTIIEGFFLPTAVAGGLRTLAFYVYGVTVPDATFATGNLVLTNGGGGVYTKAIGEYTARNPTTNATYVNSIAFTLGAGATLSVAMRAVDSGSVGNSTPNTITESVTSLLGVTVTNPAAFVGTDAPTDAAIRQLCLNKLSASSVRGVRSVYAYAIQTAVNPVTLGPVNINRWSISEASNIGIVTLSVAAPAGAPDPNDIVGIQTRVEAIARPSGVLATVVGANPVAYSPTITVWVTPGPGTTQDDIKTSIDAEISAFIAAYPIGGVTASDDTHTTFTGLFGEGIIGAIARGATKVGAVLLSVKGASDLTLAAFDVATDDAGTAVLLIAPTSGVLQ